MEKVSEKLSGFLNQVSEAKLIYKLYKEELEKQEKLTQDYLHSLELDGLNCAERSKVATKLANNRKDRRFYKDRIEELEPLVIFVNDPANKKVLDKLTEVLGATRRAENYHKSRTYIPKVLPTTDQNK
jgi:hypothetical protein